MRILVMGHKGMLGSDLMAVLGRVDEVSGVDVGEFDITSAPDCHRLIGEFNLGVVVNAAGNTEVDGCETNRHACFAVNAEGVLNVALACLLGEDPGFRERVRTRFTRALTEELTADFLAGLADEREREARALGLADLHFAATLREYFAARPDEVRAQVDEVLAALADPSLTRPPGLVRYSARRKLPD